jgi:hypothetical protein
MSEFCDECDVSLDLHGTDDPAPADCEHAEAKARLLEAFGRAFR